MAKPSRTLGQEIRDFKTELWKGNVPVLLSNPQLKSLNETLSQMGKAVCTPTDLKGLSATTHGLTYTHGVVVNRGQLPLPPSDTHIRIDLIQTKIIRTTPNIHYLKYMSKVKGETPKPYKFTRRSSVGRVRMVLTTDQFHELHVHIEPEGRNKGYGVLLYILAVIQAHKLGIDLMSSTHPSVAAHRIYYSERFLTACQVLQHHERYEVLLKTSAINAIDNVIPELLLWDTTTQFDYIAALKPHHQALERMRILETRARQPWQTYGRTAIHLPTQVAGITDDLFFDM